MMVYVIERQFLPAALWMATAALLAYFGLIHAYTLTPAGVQNHFGPGAATDFALASERVLFDAGVPTLSVCPSTPILRSGFVFIISTI